MRDVLRTRAIGTHASHAQPRACMNPRSASPSSASTPKSKVWCCLAAHLETEPGMRL